MSVCTFGAEELAVVARVILDNAPLGDSFRSRHNTVVGALAKLSEANVACFNDRYRHLDAKSEPCTAGEITQELRGLMAQRVDLTMLKRAVSTTSLIHYNCDDQGGDFTLKIEGAHHALVLILEGMLGVIAARGGI